MNTPSQPTPERAAALAHQLALIAPRPKTMEATGLTPEMLGDLLLKHVLRAGPLTGIALSDRLGLSGPVIEPLLQYLRQEGHLHLQTHANFESGPRLALTERGRQRAQDSVQRCGYVGPAPVPLDTYVRTVELQSLPRQGMNREQTRRAMRGVIMADDLCDRLGVAMSSGRAIFIYGIAGSGKTYLASRLIRAVAGEVLVPHAIAVNDKIVRVFDSTQHHSVEQPDVNRQVLLSQGFDARFVPCKRPMIIVGGDLTMEMFDIQYDAATREYHAPLQVKSNNGVLVIDDLGRQRFLPQRLFDRWIVPLEHRIDYLSFGAYARFTTPCNAIVVFSTNLEPADVADEALLRRLAYKVSLGPLPIELYTRIWSAVCTELGVEFDRALLDFALTELYPASGRPLLACHPRDLVGMALDKAAYDQRGGELRAEDLRWAWDIYFLPSSDGLDSADAGSGKVVSYRKWNG